MTTTTTMTTEHAAMSWTVAGRKPLVLLGLLGTRLDAGVNAARWDRWRPTVATFSHDDLLIDRFELLHQPRHAKLAEQVMADIARVSPETTPRAHPIELPDPWDFEAVFDALMGFADAYPFDPDAEDYLVQITTGTHVQQICLFLLAEARFLPARLLQVSPPRRGHEHGPGGYAIIDLDLQRYDRLANRFAAVRDRGLSVLKQGIATRNAAFNALIGEIEQVALASRAPLLLTGPTGAGKTHLARRIYQLKRDRNQVEGPFVEVNCATLRGDGAMSALFGHTRGAFTGADKPREGLLRAADGGVLFLDEIGELGLDEQAMLLRALEEKRFLPMGADREVQSDFQLIAGTNRDLWDEVEAGTFREDLLARIHLWAWRLPGLAERAEDLEPNLDWELERYARNEGRRVAFNREARAAFVDFGTGPDARWRGNFRDLNAAVTRMATLAQGGRIDVGGVEREIGRLRHDWAGRGGVEGDAPPGDALVIEALGVEGAADLDRFDRVQLADVLRVCKASKSLSDAGRTLFAVSRTKRSSVNDADRLRKYLARFDLRWQTLPWH